MPDKMNGRGVIAGVAIGRAMVVGKSLDGYLAVYQQDTKGEESRKAEEALAEVARVLAESAASLKEQDMPEQAGIMEAHSLLAKDPMFSGAIMAKIDDLGSAPDAVLAAAADTAFMFEQMDDEYFRERAVDIRDIGKRIAKYILGVQEPELGEEPVILCGYEIEPSVIANIPTEKLAGVILGQGSTTCHAVIIAKARAIPTIVGVGPLMAEIEDGSRLVMDGEKGEIIIAPTKEILDAGSHKRQAQLERKEYYSRLAPLPAVTTDGVRVSLMANIGMPSDVVSALTYGCEGVGLFRSEFIFMGRQNIPTEEEQFQLYKEAVEKCRGNRCVIRTMDIGGDKPLPYLNIPKEDNPFLGWRAVRISLQRRDLFMPQLKAILRAGAYGQAAVMVPMVINVSEILKVKEYIETAKVELLHEHKEFSDKVQLGIMVETPAAAVMTPTLAKYTDFFSIGTNDLVQYTLAVDRVNSKVSDLYDHFNPAVLQLIQRTVNVGRNAGNGVGMCGEMASDPYAAVLLLGMGIEELSMSAPSIPKVKEKLRAISSVTAKEAVAEVMSMEDGSIIRNYLYQKF